MKNEDILKENNGKKFDIVLMNPPYAQTLYLKFLDKCVDIADSIISINPAALIKRNTKHFDKYKEKFKDRLSEIEEVDSKDLFKDTFQCSVCIMKFIKYTDDLHIKYLDGKEEIINSILDKDYSGFSDYEKEIVKYLYNDKPNYVEGAHSVGPLSPKKNVSGYINKILKKLPDNKVYMTCLAAYSPGKGKYFSSNTGKIFDNKEDFKEHLYERNGKLANYIYFNSVKEAENCKSAMERPLLRFCILRIQTNQRIYSYHYKYIPDIDWSDERVKTDEGLLEVCGCPKDKCKEYAIYCKKIIENVDNK